MRLLAVIYILLSISINGIAQHNNHFIAEMRQPFLVREGNKIVYHLYVTDTIVNYTGKKVKAVAINGSIPVQDRSSSTLRKHMSICTQTRTQKRRHEHTFL